MTMVFNRSKVRRLVTTLLGILLLSGVFGCTISNRELVQKFTALDLPTQQVDEGVVVELPHVFFDFAEYELSAEGRVKTQEIASVVNGFRSRGRNLTISGHADSVGSATFNETLSKKRADTVRDELIFSQVDEKRILWSRGFGSTQPLTRPRDPNRPSDQSANRRVEVLVLDPGVAP